MLAHALQRAGTRGVVLRRLAEQRGWSLRALYRDIALLEQAGYPVVHEGQRYRLIDGWQGTSALGIDAEELHALFLARILAVGWSATSLGKGLDRLWEKLTTTRHPQTSLLPGTEAPWLGVRAPFGIDYRAHTETIAAIEHALRARRVLRAAYQARGPSGRRETTTRDLEPGELYWDPGLESLYLFAYCRLRRDIRIFAVHRFRLVEVLDEPFTPRASSTSRNALRSAFRVWRSEHLRRVRVRFAADAAEYVRERRWHDSQQLVEVGHGALELALEVAGLEEIERWLLGFGASVEVLEPAELRARLRLIHEQCLGQGKRALAARRSPA